MDAQKEEIMTHHRTAIEWVRSLEKLTEEEWRTPIMEDKWSTAEIIGHFIPWDQFVLEKRIPYFYQNKPLPKAPDADELNRKAALESRNGKKEDTIEIFISTRENLQAAIGKIDEALWSEEITIGKSNITLYNYLNELAKHDKHHFSQIREFLEKSEPDVMR